MQETQERSLCLSAAAQEFASLLFNDTLSELRGLRLAGERTILLTGADGATRRALAAEVLPEACVTSCLTRIDVKKGDSCALIVHDVDASGSETLCAILDGYTNVVLGTAATEVDVPTVLRRSYRFGVHVRIGAATFASRAKMWNAVVKRLFSHESMEVAYTLCAETPGIGIKDVLRICARFHATRGHDVCERLLLAARGMSRTTGLSFAHAMRSQTAEHVGGYVTVQEELERALGWGARYGSTYIRLGTRAPRGVLLHGDRGTGKTLLTRTLASRLRHVNWIHVDGGDIYSRYLGDSERRIRSLFTRARELAPCVLVIDDIDAIAASREFDEDGGSGGTGVERRVLGALLAELDGVCVDARFIDVQLLACTSRLDALDAALLRPGRIDKVVEIVRPSREDRVEILRVITREMPVDGNMLGKIADAAASCTGADLAAICCRAALVAMSECEMPKAVLERHFMQAIAERG